MNRKARILWSLLCFGCVIGFAVAQNSIPHESKEPTVFQPDDENEGFDNADPPSNDVLNSLLKTAEARQMSAKLENLDHEQLRKLFEVVKVHLGDSRELVEVVLGHSAMSGVDSNWFWIVRCLPGHSEVILFANGNGLEVLKTRTAGYKDIRTIWSSAAGYSITTVYRYDGIRYKFARKRTTTVKPPGK